jgi:hypothetical protein
MASKACSHLGRTLREACRPPIPRSISRCPSRLSCRRTISSSGPSRPRLVREDVRCRRRYHYYTNVERDHERIIQTSIGKVDEFNKASKAVSHRPREKVTADGQLSEGSGVQEAIELSKVLKDLGPLRNTWDEYTSLRQVREYPIIPSERSG